jgi:putative hydrolase of the HAD superfamily
VTQTIRAVLFDYGVVLSGPPDPAAWARMREITGLAEAQFRPAYWAFRDEYDRGLAGPEYWLATGRHAGLELSPEQVAGLIEADTSLWTQRNQPMVDWALRLQTAGTPTGILSNLGDAMTAGVLARQPWLSGFDHLLWSHTVKMAKPDAAIYTHSAEGLGLPPENIFFVDDRATNVHGALAAGMQTILYSSQAAFEEEMEERELGELWRTGAISERRKQIPTG